MKVTVNGRAEQRIRQRHPWIFADDILESTIDTAGPVFIYNQNKRFLASALYSPQSKIRLRIYSHEKTDFNETFLRKKITQGFDLRQRLYGEATCYRVIFGESDGIPSLIIDRYHDLYVIQTLSAGLEPYKETIFKILKEDYRPTSMVERNDAQVRHKEGLPLIKQFVFGPAPEVKIIELQGVQFEFRPLEGQKTGFFLDQKENAQLAGKYFSGEILDCFCYEGQFALHLAKHADKIISVDSSMPALQQLQRNAELNHTHNIETLEGNVFDVLRGFDQQKRKFDGIVLDPPAFVKTKSTLKTAIRGYKEINLRAIRLLKEEGRLATFSCSQNLSDSTFLQLLQEAAFDAKRQVQIIARFNQPADHPILLSAQETHYLKGFLLRCL